jgi:hypothetical protein
MTPLLKCMSEDLWDEREFDNEETYLVCRYHFIYTNRAQLRFEFVCIVSQQTDSLHRLAQTEILCKAYQSPGVENLPFPSV